MKEGSRKTGRIGEDGFADTIPGYRIRKGAVINKRYRIIANIGSGGFGKVFKATDLLLNKDVALKFLDPEVHRDKKKLLRVKREVNISQKITDERVIKIFNIEHFGSIPFLVMEFIEGKNLGEYIRGSKNLNWEDLRPVFMDIMDGISALHEKGIVHRDIKPGNILITKDRRVKIIDFGLSKEVSDIEKTSTAGEIIGSPKYMSPEQIRGEDIGHHSDIYQLGLILYYALNPGEEKGSESSTIEQLLDRVSRSPRKMYRMSRSVPGFLRSGIHKALETDRRLRFGSVNEMKEYFIREKFTYTEKFTGILVRRKRAAAAFLFALILLFSSVFLYVRGSRSILGLEFDGPALTASNRFGIKLFSRDYSPLSVLEALPFRIDSDFANLRSRFSKEGYLKRSADVAVVFLTKKDLYKEIASLPLNSQEFYSTVSLVDHKGRTLRTHDFHLLYDNPKKPLFSGWMNFSDIRKISAGGGNAIVFSAFQHMSMYPSEICVLDQKNFHVVNNPGHIEKSYFYTDKAGHIRGLLIGMNNPFCHFRFICDIDFSVNRHLTLPPTIVRDFPNRAVTDFPLILIPRKTEILKHEWGREGTIAFRSQTDGRIFTVNRNGELTISGVEGSRTYRDDPDELNRMYRLLSLAFLKKAEKNLFPDPGLEIREALGLNISSPVLRALMNYFAGDMCLSAGRYEEAEGYFSISEGFLKDNGDLEQKMSELYFLSDDREKLAEQLGNNSMQSSNYFGLGPLGITFFRIYDHLHTGEFRNASDITGDYLKAEPYFRSMISIFKGEYGDALTKSMGLIGSSTTPFTLSEARLLYARAVLLNMVSKRSDKVISSEDQRLAEFYFSDIAVNSVPDGHLSAVSRACFMALKGDRKNSLRYAGESLAKLITDSRGNIFSRLWLFYDAFIYAKTMETLGNQREAARGYELCIRSNPHTGAAAESALVLKKMMETTISGSR